MSAAEPAPCWPALVSMAIAGVWQAWTRTGPRWSGPGAGPTWSGSRARRQTAVGVLLDLATMTGHAFQCLVTDHDLSASLAAICASLREGGRLVFETRHPQARAWQDWNPSNASEVTDAAGRVLRVWHEVESVADEVVTLIETTAGPDGTVFRVDRASLRFPGTGTLNAFLAAAGFGIEAQYGDWHRGPVTGASREIITVARNQG